MTSGAPSGHAPSIEDAVEIAAPPARVFAALTLGHELSRWWPKAASSQPHHGGRLVLTWFNGGTMETTFATFRSEHEVAFAFYSEYLAFSLAPVDQGTRLTITHRCSPDAAIHVAQAWGFLKANLKAWIEHGIDLR